MARVGNIPRSWMKSMRAKKSTCLRDESPQEAFGNKKDMSLWGGKIYIVREDKKSEWNSCKKKHMLESGWKRSARKHVSTPSIHINQKFAMIQDGKKTGCKLSDVWEMPCLHSPCTFQPQIFQTQVDCHGKTLMTVHQKERCGRHSWQLGPQEKRPMLLQGFLNFYQFLRSLNKCPSVYVGSYGNVIDLLAQHTVLKLDAIAQLCRPKLTKTRCLCPCCDRRLHFIMADNFFRWIEYRKRVEKAGIIMPCSHVAIVIPAAGASSSSAGVSSVSYEHHAILDSEKEEYIHVMPAQKNGEASVVRTGRRAFEADGNPRVVKQPASIQEAHDIVARARSFANNGLAWRYDWRNHNCEHFVNHCWNPDEPPESRQAGNAVKSIGGSTASGAVVAGAGSGVVAAVTPIATVVTTTSTVPTYLLGIIPWGAVTTTSSVTVMTRLSLGAILGIGAAGTLAGGIVVGGVAYGVREWLYQKATQNAQLVPIAVYNRSNQAITASLQNINFTLACCALQGIGIISVDLESNMAKELNPPTVTELEDFDTDFRVQVSSQSLSPKSCKVRRGDVVIFDGQRLRRASRRVDLQCCVCLDRPPDVLLEPCKHHEFCEQCILQVMAQDGLCPLCRIRIQEYIGPRT